LATAIEHNFFEKDLKNVKWYNDFWSCKRR
jgi:hypothetical protein